MKYWIHWHSFMGRWAVKEASMMDVEEEEVDLLGALLEGDKYNAFDALIAASNGRGRRWGYVDR